MLSFYIMFWTKDRRTDIQTDIGKTIYPPSFDAGHTNFRHLQMESNV